MLYLFSKSQVMKLRARMLLNTSSDRENHIAQSYFTCYLTCEKKIIITFINIIISTLIISITIQSDWMSLQYTRM